MQGNRVRYQVTGFLCSRFACSYRDAHIRNEIDVAVVRIGNPDAPGFQLDPAAVARGTSQHVVYRQQVLLRVTGALALALHVDEKVCIELLARERPDDRPLGP